MVTATAMATGPTVIATPKRNDWVRKAMSDRDPDGHARHLSPRAGACPRRAESDGATLRRVLLPRVMSQSLICGGTGVAAAVLSQIVCADPLIASAGLLTRFIATDNLFMSGQNPQSDQILQILPNVTSAGTSRRGTWRLYYGPSFIVYSGHSDLNRIFHVLQGDASFDLIEDYLGLNMTANANQNLIDPAVSNAGFDALGNPTAFAQTASFQISPIIRLPIVRGDFATLEFAPGINFVFSGQTAGGSGSSVSNGSQSSLRVSSGAYFSRLAWSISATSNLVGSGDGGSRNGLNVGSGTGTAEVYADATYAVTDQWKLQGLVGYDWGNYDSQQNPNGLRWRLTPYWSPSQHARVGLGYGYRYSGADYYANIGYTRGKMSLSATYEIVVSSARSSILTSNPVSFQDPYGQPIDQPLNSQVLSGTVTNPALSAGYYIQDHLNLAASRQFGRTNASLSIDSYRWDYQDSGQVVNQNQGTLTLGRSLSKRASASLSLQYWVYNQADASAGEFDQVSAWAQYDYRINPRSTGSLRYTYSQQTSSSSLRNFDSNSLWLTFNWSM